MVDKVGTENRHSIFNALSEKGPLSDGKLQTADIKGYAEEQSFLEQQEAVGKFLHDIHPGLSNTGLAFALTAALRKGDVTADELERMMVQAFNIQDENDVGSASEAQKEEWAREILKAGDQAHDEKLEHANLDDMTVKKRETREKRGGPEYVFNNAFKPAFSNLEYDKNNQIDAEKLKEIMKEKVTNDELNVLGLNREEFNALIDNMANKEGKIDKSELTTLLDEMQYMFDADRYEAPGGGDDSRAEDVKRLFEVKAAEKRKDDHTNPKELTELLIDNKDALGLENFNDEALKQIADVIVDAYGDGRNISIDNFNNFIDDLTSVHDPDVFIAETLYNNIEDGNGNSLTRGWSQGKEQRRADRLLDIFTGTDVIYDNYSGQGDNQVHKLRKLYQGDNETLDKEEFLEMVRDLRANDSNINKLIQAKSQENLETKEAKAAIDLFLDMDRGNDLSWNEKDVEGYLLDNNNPFLLALRDEIGFDPGMKEILAKGIIEAYGLSEGLVDLQGFKAFLEDYELAKAEGPEVLEQFIDDVLDGKKAEM